MDLTLGFPEFQQLNAGREAGLQSILAHLENLGRRAEPPVRAIRHEPASPGAFSDFPEAVEPALRRALERRGVSRLYTHQAEAFAVVASGRNLVIVTPTASGKTLCYNLPVLNHLLRDPGARAMYLFPTKALSEDQLHEVQTAVDGMGSD